MEKLRKAKDEIEQEELTREEVEAGGGDEKGRPKTLKSASLRPTTVLPAAMSHLQSFHLTLARCNRIRQVLKGILTEGAWRKGAFRGPWAAAVSLK